MELEKELKKLDKLKSIDADLFESQYLLIRKNFTSLNEVRLIDNYVHNMITETEKKHNAFIEYATMVMQQREVAQAI
jgi:hypothetical protein